MPKLRKLSGTEVITILGRFGGRYDPLLCRDSHEWVPANDFARQLVLLRATWEDIARLADLRAQQTANDDIKLLTRYIALEIGALAEILGRLRDLTFEPSADPAHPELLTQLRTALREHNRQLDQFRRLMTDVRNQFVAHRPALEPEQFYILWERLDWPGLDTLLRTVPPVFDLLRNVGLDVWARRGRDTSRHVAFPFRLPTDEAC